MLENGFIVLSRKICNWRWYTNANTFRVFIHILLQANYEDRDFENITIKRGQLVSTPEKIAKNLKLTRQEVRTSIKHLISTNEITTKGYNKFTVFTVVNYNQYQTKQPPKQPTTNQQLTTKQPTTNHNETIYNKANKETNINAAAEIHKPGDIAPMPPRRYVPDAPPPEIDYIGGAKD